MTQYLDTLPYLTADGLTQMAIDAELARACDASAPRAVARCYNMDPPAVTIGRHQKWRSVVDPGICRRRGWDWVRRPTGGGALLHHRELNFSVATSYGLLASGRESSRPALREAFGMVMSGVVEALKSLGCCPVLWLGRQDVTSPQGAGTAHGLCEHALTRHEITVDGRKAVAAAQLNLTHAFLLHGTVYFASPGADDRFWAEPAPATAPDPHWWAIGRTGSALTADRQRLAEIVLSRLASALHLSERPVRLTAAETAAVERRKSSWLSEGWNVRR